MQDRFFQNEWLRVPLEDALSSKFYNRFLTKFIEKKADRLLKRRSRSADTPGIHQL